MTIPHNLRVACITGTRIAVSVLLDNLTAGASVEDLLREYPSLTPEAIAASLAYAAAAAAQRGR